MNIRYEIHTYGCKVNTYDSGLLQKRLAQAGFERHGEPRVHILNTCAVTREATREAVRHSRRLKARDPLAVVVVTGCAAQVDTDDFANLPGVDLVVANSHKGRIEELIGRYLRGELRERVHKSNIFKKDDLEPGGGLDDRHTRAFLKIQDGCNSFCTFCVIPFARGKSRSLSIDQIVSRIGELGDIPEVVLTGVHIGDYDDDGRGLEDLVESVLNRTRIPRVRLTSLEPVEVSTRLLDLFKDDRLCPHFHMSIQSASTPVLRAMKRKYDSAAVEDALHRIHAAVPGAYVGMDVIAGFAGESQDEFLDSYRRLNDTPWTRLHVFPYSARPGTHAARTMTDLPAGEVRSRAARLRELSAERWTKEARAQIGSVKAAIPLKNGRWLARDFWTLSGPVPGPAERRERRLKVAGISEQHLLVDAMPDAGL